MASPKKETSDPNLGPAYGTRKRASASPMSISPSKRQQKRRMSKKDRRRVSFAPDPELTMVHTFEKDDESMAPSPPLLPSRPLEPHTFEQAHNPSAPHPALTGIPEAEPLPLGSPVEVPMDITQPIKFNILQPQYTNSDHHQQQQMWMQQPGDVTASVPSLGALAEADEQEQAQFDVAAMLAGPQTHNITAAIPSLDDLLEEDVAGQQQQQQQYFASATVGGGHQVPDEGMDLTVAVGRVLETNAAGEQQQQQQLAGATPTEVRPPSLSPGQAVEGQKNKWGFVPGGDDTMDLNLEMHGHMIMGDHTYSRMYNDNNTGNTTLGWGAPAPAVNHNSTDISPAPAAAAEEQQQQPAALEEEAPNWTAPAFLPPYTSEPAPVAAPPAVVDHPALRRSPEMSESSLNTMSTRRISVGVDARRQSVTSHRRASAVSLPMGGFGGVTGGLLMEEGTPATGNAQNRRGRSSLRGRPSDITDNLLRDDSEDFEGVEGAEGGFLAGIKQQMRLLSNGGDGVAMAGGESFPTPTPALPPVSEEGPEEAEQQQQVGQDPEAVDTAPIPPEALATINNAANNGHVTKTPFSVADSSHGNGATAGLLRTGGTTDLLRADDGDNNNALNAAGNGGGVGADAPGTGATHGTTRLLRMDVTASSAIAPRILAHHGLDGELDDILKSPLENGNAVRVVSLSPGGIVGVGGDQGDDQQPVPAVSFYPEIDDDMLLNDDGNAMIPGGPKLARTPQPSLSAAAAAGGQLQQQQHPEGAAAMPTSVRSIHSVSQFAAPPAPTPVTHRMGMVGRPSFGAASLPGSAITARYPGSAAAVHRLSHGFTPLSVQPITFQDFARMMDVQFLDNLRRGASINYADLQPNPVPETLNDAMRLMCIIGPNVQELETAIHTLQTEGARLRTNSADMEAALGQANPPIFRHIQMASADQLEVFRSNVGLLKKVCRQKAVALLKDVRCQMEDSKRRRLQRAFAILQTDLATVQEFSSHMEGVAEAAQRYAEEFSYRMQEETLERKAEAEKRKRLSVARTAMEQQLAANTERLARLEAAKAKAEALRQQRTAMEAERVQLAAEGEQLSVAVQEAAAAAAAANDNAGEEEGAPPREVLDKLRQLERLQQCLGWRLEAAKEDPIDAEASFIVRDLFRLRVTAAKSGARCEAQLLPQGSNLVSTNSVVATLTNDRRSLAASVAGATGGVVTGATVPLTALPAAVQALNCRLSRAIDLAAYELDGLRLACRPLCEATCDAATGTLKLCFVNLDAEVRFAVTLRPASAYPAGPLEATTKIWFNSDGQISKDAIMRVVEEAPRAPGRIRAICMALGQLASSAVKKPATPPVCFEQAPIKLAAATPGEEGVEDKKQERKDRRRETIFENPLFGRPGAGNALSTPQV